ncbi:MAG TPA: LTA synthase family protein [Prolixibacteraceae bacterium]|nr:LTA synthase family protein [Prolixibacteraceae bacterium]
MSHFKESMQLIIRSLRRFLSLSFILASMILMVRFYELIITFNFSNYPPESFHSLLAGLKYDLVLYLRISAILMVPFLLIAYFSQKIARYFFITSSIFLILGDILLLQYFSAALVPLGADLLGYSLTEIRHTIGASGELNIFPFIVIALYLSLMVRVFIKHVYFRLKPWMMSVLTILMLGSLLPIKQFNPQPAKFENEFNLFAANNKLNFFAQSMINHYVHQGTLNDKPFTFTSVASSPEGNPFIYINPDYPFLHQETTPDVLGGYFNLGETPPNIVLIIVESLGRAYSGEGAYLGSFTPFLDSLMQKSLYWENCLSTSGRTFQVLPTTLASLPFGDHGFAELDEKMPDHISLISILKKQAGYTSSFVYGGEAEFDKMDVFMNRQGIDQIIDSKKFGAEYNKIPAKGNGFSWGYGDREIFSRYLEDVKSRPNSPRMDVLLTLSMHDPFNLPNQESYNHKFENRLNSLDLSEKTKTFDLQYTKQFASMIYFDESLRYFFQEIRKSPSFANTIFIITGDHRMPEIPISTQIDRFHVPLVVYSPMLKKAEKFSAVITHFDITPSIIAMLDAAKYISRPSVASWIGHGIDNSTEFRSLQTYPLMRNKNEILDLLSSEQFLANQTIYQLYPSMDIEPMDNTTRQKQLKEELDNFLRKNNYACINNKLIPDSLKKYNLP